jgi:peptidoglycan-associated lipoprotein
MRKLGALALLLSALAFDTAPRSAEACGVKLTLKSSRPKRPGEASLRSVTHVLMVGSLSKRLQQDVSTKGRDVEVASTIQDGKRSSYDVIVVGNRDEATEAKQRYPRAAIVVRSGDAVADAQTIDQASRRKTASHGELVAYGPTKAEPVATKTENQPTATKGGADEKLIGTKTPDRDRQVGAKNNGPGTPVQPKVDKVASEPKLADTKVADTKVADTKVDKADTKIDKADSQSEPEPKSDAKPETDRVATTTQTHTETAPSKPAATASATLDEEVYFAFGSAAVTNKQKLDKVAKWLKNSPDVHANVEGYADPTGTPSNNMALSQLRADAVRDYLVAKGIDSSRLDVAAYGDTKLKYDAHDARNRRVAIEAK